MALHPPSPPSSGTSLSLLKLLQCSPTEWRTSLGALLWLTRVNTGKGIDYNVYCRQLHANLQELVEGFPTEQFSRSTLDKSAVEQSPPLHENELPPLHE